jgi:hypothetical protein
MTRDSVTTTLRWVGDWSITASIIAAAILGIAAWLLYRRDGRGNAFWMRMLLPTLRALAVVLIVLMLSGPVLHHRRIVGQLAHLTVALDASESMQLTDSSMDAGRKMAIAGRLGLLDGVSAQTEIPQASEKLSTARGLTLNVSAVDAPDEAAWKRISSEFSARVTEADNLFSNASKDKEIVNRFRTELVKPAQEIATRTLKAVDDRTRAASELGKLGEAAGRWSRDVADIFQKQVDTDPALSPLKAALAKFDAMPRWQRAQAYLMGGKAEQKILATLAQQHDVQVVLLENGNVKPFWKPSAHAEMPAGLPKAEGVVTDLTSGLKFAENENSNSVEKGAVIFLTDGQHNAGDAPIEAARVLAGRNMGVYSLGFGSQVPPRDLAVLKTVVPDSVFFEDRVRGDVVLKEEVPAGQPFTLTIKEGDKMVWEKQLITEGKALRRVPFEFPVKEIAEVHLKQLKAQQGYDVLGVPLELTASVSGLEGDRELSNNTSALRFRAVTQKRKILLLDGRPRWESRYLRNLFSRDEKWEVNAVVAGATSDVGFVRGDKDGTFPNEPKLLDSYDLIIFGEVMKSQLKEEEMKWIADFVGKRGGAMIFIDGPRGALRGYADTPLGSLIPVEWPGPGVRGGLKSITLTERASNIGAFALSDDLATNADTWTRLPVPHYISGAKPLSGAEVFMEVDTGTQKLAAAVMRPFGAGRVYYHAFDDSWRWRYEVADMYHVKFWNQLAGYIAEPPFAARDKYVQLDAGQFTYQAGQSADMRVRLRDADGKPVTDAAVATVLYRDGQKVATITLNPDASGLYRGKTASLEPGSYEVAVESAMVPDGQLKARTQFKVVQRESAERSLLSMNEDLLRQVSVAGAGEFFREEQCDELVKKLAPLSSGEVQETDTVLWQSWWWFGAIVALLTVEWILRKRSGML